jgi:hypothetical protein
LAVTQAALKLGLRPLRRRVPLGGIANEPAGQANADGLSGAETNIRIERKQNYECIDSMESSEGTLGMEPIP